MSIKQIIENITYTAADVAIIKSKLNTNKSRWDDGDIRNKNVKKKIRKFLIESHKSTIIDYNEKYVECAYCGCWIGASSRGEIEHIAHKSKYVAFEYLNSNLVYVCSYCNGSSKKGQKDVVINWDNVSDSININHPNIFNHLEDIYNKLEFTIVHPKFDNPNDHYKWKDTDKILLSDHLSEQGGKSIEMFKLKDYAMVEQRLMQRRREKEFCQNPTAFKKTMELI